MAECRDSEERMAESGGQLKSEAYFHEKIYGDLSIVPSRSLWGTPKKISASQ